MPKPKYILISTITALTVILMANIWPLFSNQEPEIITLKTGSIPHLYPHRHDPGDSLTQDSHHEFLPTDTLIAPKDLWIKNIEFSLHNAHDTVLHHADLFRYDISDWHCEKLRRVLLSVGEDQMYNPNLILPEGYAIFIPKGTPISMITMLHNPEPPVGYGEDHYNVSADLKLTLANEKEAKELKAVSFIRLYLSENPCILNDEETVFKVPANTQNFEFGTSTATTSSTSVFTFPHDGTIVYTGAHLHGWEGGKYLDMYINGELIKRYETYKSEDDPYRYDTIHSSENISIKAGDIVSITATYNNPNSIPVIGAMGILGIYFSPSLKRPE